MDAAELQFHMLCHLSDGKPKHGYSIKETLETAIDPNRTTRLKQIYPTLTMFEEKGWTKTRVDRNSKNGPPKVEHTITEAGQIRRLELSAELSEELNERQRRIEKSRTIAGAKLKEERDVE